MWSISRAKSSQNQKRPQKKLLKLLHQKRITASTAPCGHMCHNMFDLSGLERLSQSNKNRTLIDVIEKEIFALYENNSVDFLYNVYKKKKKNAKKIF